MIGRALSGGFIAAALVVAALPPAPVRAQAEPQVILKSISAELFAEAFDGGGPGPPPETDGDTDFEDFIGDITAEDSAAEPGRDATATAFQGSRVRGIIGPPSSERIRTEGSAEAETSDTDDDQVPEGHGTSTLSATIEVTGGPAAYRMVGEMGATASARNRTCSQAITSLNPGNVFSFSANTQACGPGSRGNTSFDKTGLLPPGTYSFLIQANAASSANNGRDARAKVTFDVVLQFESCTIVAEAGVVTIGTGDDDLTCGTDGSDDIRGGGGRDTIYGFGDVDSLEGEQDGDTIFGGEGGADSFTGGPGLDFASGGPGNDQLTMGGGGSIVLGDAGNDIIEGGAGLDEFNGGPGNDTLTGAGGQDFLNGDDGDDCLVGGAGRDDYRGGGGNDAHLARDGLRDTGSGGPGPDRGRFDAVDQIGSVANRSFQGGC